MIEVKLVDVVRALSEVQEAMREITHILELFERQKTGDTLPASILVPDDFAHVCAQTGEKSGYAADC
ncbi:MAG: hypothetical protein HYU59_00505 [Magnetospirillum gryphiswaldense]|nr:hypothetical protein [Magnetospirillum gryphiswaldense]